MKKSTKGGRKLSLLYIAIGGAGILLAAALTLYPLVSNTLAEKNKSLVLTDYAEAVEEIEDESIASMLDKAQEYNANLVPGTISIDGAFSQEALIAAAEDYDGLLRVGASGVMGYVEIPKIAVYLPIYHGTGSDALDNGVGHLLGSSLPVGGINTHSVLTGHSGLAREKMFSDLDQLQEGDIFYVHVLNMTLAYEVDQIKIVLPENTDYLGIEKEADYCTLVTCTPFGVNTHRLLVRGHRVPYEEAEAMTEAEQELDPAPSTWTREYIKGIVIALAAAVVMAIIAGMIGKRGQHENG